MRSLQSRVEEALKGIYEETNGLPTMESVMMLLYLSEVLRSSANVNVSKGAKRIVVTEDGITGSCRCGNCGTSIELHDAYCRGCGARMEG